LHKTSTQEMFTEIFTLPACFWKSTELK